MRGQNRPIGRYSSWAAVVMSSAALAIVIYLKVRWHFEDDIEPLLLSFLLLLLIFVTPIAILLGLPRWQSFFAAVILTIVGYFTFFTELYWMPG